MTLQDFWVFLAGTAFGSFCAAYSSRRVIRKFLAEARAERAQREQESIDRVAYRLAELDRKGSVATLPAPLPHSDQLLSLILRELGTDRLQRPRK